MIRAHGITFQKLVSAGYISAETYHYLLPKERLSELTLSEVDGYKHQYKSELLPLFEDVDIYLTIAYMEKLDSQLKEGNDTPYMILIDCLCEYPVEIEHLVSDIGKRKFLQEYIYCTEEALKAKSLISYDNIKTVISFRNKFRSLFQLSCSGLEVEEWKSHLADISSSPQTGTTEGTSIASGEGFNSTDYVSIDDDAVSLSNADCKKYVLFLYSLNKDQLDSVVDFLISLLRTISIRTWNGIKYLGYREFLINYLFADSVKLLNLRNFGRKSLVEFEAIKPAIVDYIKDLYINGNTESVEDSLKKEKEAVEFKIRTLKERIGDSQYKLVADLLSKLLKDVSVRSRNGIKAYKGDFIEDFVDKNQDIKSINNIGRKSESEIMLVIKKLREYIATLNERELSEDELIIVEKQSYYEDYFDKYAHDYLIKNGHLPMFYLLELFFRRVLETNRNFQIYNLRSPIFKNVESKTLEEIAEERNLTRERVRQIHMKYRKRLYEVEDVFKDKDEFSFAKIIDNSNDWKYVIDDLLAYNCIDISMLTDYCALEKHHFTDDFVLYIIGAVLRNDYLAIGKPLLPYPTKSYDEWNNCYLIKKQLTDKFDLMRLFELIEEYEDSNTEDLVASAREMILDTFLPAWIDYDSNVVEEVSDVVSNLLIQELGIIPDDQFRFTIKGEKEENVADVIYDILKSNGDPLSCEELFQSIDSIYPHKYKSPASIKTLVGRDLRLCLVGGNNLVALIEWEHVKLGSIRNIIVQYLEEFDEPQPIKDIVSYVQSHRDTSDNSVRASIGSGDQFVQFSGGYYGLSWKQYPEVFYLDESDRTFYKRIQEFEQFLQTHNHFPFPSSNRKEQDLHNWWIQVKSYLKMSKYQKGDVKRIETKYKNLARKKKYLRWFDNCRQYYEFVQEHHRRPSKSIPDEQELCVWLQKASEDFSDGKLTYQQESCYLDLCKSL